MNKYKYWRLISWIEVLGVFFFVGACQKSSQIKDFDKVAVIEESNINTKAKPLPAEDPVFSVGENTISKAKFKNILQTYLISDSTSFESLLQEIIEKQLLIEEGKRLGYDLDADLVNSIETQARILSKDYVADSSLIKELAEEAYANLQSEVELAHILIYVPTFATAAEKANALQQLQKFRADITSGNKTFAELAANYSDDKKTAVKGGNMGWFSGLQLLYPLEKTAYNLSVGEISEPVETKYGFHLVKLLNKRLSQGRVVVQQILKSIPTNSDSAFILKQKVAIDSIYQQLNTTNFEELCKKYSDDFISRDNGGVLPEFWVGSREEKIFEETAFRLNVGETSKPFQTTSGWHIIKIKSKQPLPSFAKLKDEIVRKVTTDSRGEFIDEKWIENVKTQLDYRANQSIISYVKSLANQDLLNRTWKIPFGDSIYQTFLFSVDGTSVSVKEFFDYLNDQQQVEKIEPNYTPAIMMEKFYHQFETKKIKEFGEKNMIKLNSELQFIVEEMKNTTTKNRVLDERVLGKSVSDTLAQKNYFKTHLNLYKFPERATAISVVTNDSSKITLFKEIRAEGSPYRLRRGIYPIYFSKNSTELSEKDKERIIGLASYLNRKPTILVEIGGHIDVAEPTFLANERIQQVIKELSKYNVNLTQLREFDYGTSKLGDRFDWTKNQRVTFQFFSTDIRDLEKVLSNDSSKVEINELFLTKESLKKLNGVEWSVGSYNGKSNDVYQLISIEKIEEARNKTFTEAKSQVIKDYQKDLETQLYKELKSRFPVKVNKTLAKQIFEEVKKLQSGN